MAVFEAVANAGGPYCDVGGFDTDEHPLFDAMRNTIASLARRQTWDLAVEAFEAAHTAMRADPESGALDDEAALTYAQILQTPAPDAFAALYKLEVVIDAAHCENKGDSLHSATTIARLWRDGHTKGARSLMLLRSDLERISEGEGPVVPNFAVG